MRSASRLFQGCRLLAVAQGGEPQQRGAALACKLAAPWSGSSCARGATTAADVGAPPLASPQSPGGGPLMAYTRGVETGKYRADPQQVRRA